MSEKKVAKLGVIDPTSYANTEKIKVINIELYLDIDFDQQILTGKVHLKAQKQENVKTSHLVLDTKNLKIHKVYDLYNHKPLRHEVGESYGNFGSPLVISLPPKDDENIYEICIEYETSPDASALQWLTPEQTLGKKAPFMFSQCQAIHCRSIVPLQDTPSSKFTYKAEITAPKDLTVLMSAIRTCDAQPQAGNKLLWSYSQTIPIPSYLIAIVAGRLKGRIIGAKTTVYAEPEIVKNCVYEFSETTEMLKAAVKICGPYVWGRYDLLVLPPSFPYGGMENPCLTFVTPTLLAGDKSLVNVVAHEIAHSWTGNLVTNVNFEHFWLNEGFTTYVERKIVGALNGESHRHFEAILGLNSLQDTVVKTLGETNPLTCLVPRLKDVDPDDAFSTVPYEKGHTLLFYLETILNKEGKFDKFLQAYLDKFKFQSIKTEDFKNFLLDYFVEKKEDLDDVDWNTWLYCPGMPPVIPEYDNTLMEEVDALVKKWREWVPSEGCVFGLSLFTKAELDALISPQKCLFFAKFLEGEPLSTDKLKSMYNIYQMNNMQNAEVLFQWLRVCIRGRWVERLPDCLKFINEQGRMKFVRPIYRDLYQWEEVRETVLENFQKNRDSMMFVLSNLLEKDLHISSDQ